MGYTLVSIGRLDKSGYQSLFGGGQLELTSPEGCHIGLIIHTECGLYHVSWWGLPPSQFTRDVDEAAIVKCITIAELHRHMGHIAPAATKALVAKGLCYWDCTERLIGGLANLSILHLWEGYSSAHPLCMQRQPCD